MQHYSGRHTSKFLCIIYMHSLTTPNLRIHHYLTALSFLLHYYFTLQPSQSLSTSSAWFNHNSDYQSDYRQSKRHLLSNVHLKSELLFFLEIFQTISLHTISILKVKCDVLFNLPEGSKWLKRLTLFIFIRSFILIAIISKGFGRAEASTWSNQAIWERTQRLQVLGRGGIRRTSATSERRALERSRKRFPRCWVGQLKMSRRDGTDGVMVFFLKGGVLLGYKKLWCGVKRSLKEWAPWTGLEMGYAMMGFIITIF